MTTALQMELVEWSCEQFGATFEAEKAVQPQHENFLELAVLRNPGANVKFVSQ